MAKNNPRTKSLSNKKQKARRMGVDVTDIKISNKLTDSELQALDRKLNKLIKGVNPNYKPKDFKIISKEPKSSPTRAKREKRVDSASNLLKQLKQAQSDYIKSIPSEMMKERHYKEYFLNGRHLFDVEHPYGLDTIGFKMKKFKTVKDAKEFFGTKSQNKIERLLKNEIKQLELNKYENQNKFRKEMVNDILQKREEQGHILSVLERSSVDQRLNKMDLFQLTNFVDLLEHSHNVYDSIYDSFSEEDTDSFEKTIDILLKIALKEKKLSWY